MRFWAESERARFGEESERARFGEDSERARFGEDSERARFRQHPGGGAFLYQEMNAFEVFDHSLF